MSDDQNQHEDPSRLLDDDQADLQLRALTEALINDVPQLLPRVRADVRAKLQRSKSATRPLLFVAAAVLAAAAVFAIVRLIPNNDAQVGQNPRLPLQVEVLDGGATTDANTARDLGPLEGPPLTWEEIPSLNMSSNGCGFDLQLSLTTREPLRPSIQSVALVMREYESLPAEGHPPPVSCEGTVVHEIDAALFREANALVQTRDEDLFLALPLTVAPPATHCGGNYNITVCLRDGAGRLWNTPRTDRDDQIMWRDSEAVTSTSDLSEFAYHTDVSVRSISTPSGRVWLDDLVVGAVVVGADPLDNRLVETRLQRIARTPEIPTQFQILLENRRVVVLSGHMRVWADGVFVPVPTLAVGQRLRTDQGETLRVTKIDEVSTDTWFSGENIALDVRWPNTLFRGGVLVHDDFPPTMDQDDHPAIVTTLSESVRALPQTPEDCSLVVNLEIDALPATPVSLAFARHRGRAGTTVAVDCARATVGAVFPRSLLERAPVIAGHRTLSVSRYGQGVDCRTGYAVIACLPDDNGALHSLPNAQARWAMTGYACFAAGTAVTTPSGTVAIETLHPGAQVVALDPETDEQRAVAVTNLIARGARPILALGLSNGVTLHVTAEHPLYDPNARTFRLAGEWQVGEALLGENGESVVITSRESAGTAPVFDLSVEGPHTYFAGGVLAHNY